MFIMFYFIIIFVIVFITIMFIIIIIIIIIISFSAARPREVCERGARRDAANLPS